MRLRVRCLEARDVNECAALVATRPEEQRRYGPLLDHLPWAWLKLIRTGSLTSALLEDIDGSTPKIAGLGVSVFITDNLLLELKTFPLAWIGPTLIKQAYGTTSSILNVEQIRQANSYAGLNLAVWVAIVSGYHSDQIVDVELHRSFFETHSGYQIKELICQPFDLQQIHATLHAGLFWLSEEGQYVDARWRSVETLPNLPFLIGGDRATANRAFGSWFSAQLFSHKQPRIYFRPAEQRLLLAALRGLTDDELSDELRISLSAVKKTWRMIYERAGLTRRDSMRDGGEDECIRRRGKERKHHLLTYLRTHLEELRPVLPPSKRTGRREAG